MQALPSSYQTFIHMSKYARWLEGQGRKETWPETVDRYMTFIAGHVLRTTGWQMPQPLQHELRAAILDLEVMPSMRALMSAGPAMQQCNMAAFNCSYMPIKDIRCCDEMLYILMSGTGVGFSVERKYVQQLPAVPDSFSPGGPLVIVQDSRRGWIDALRQVVAALYDGQVPTWDVSSVRPAGAPLKTFGGRASGPEPLVELFEFLVSTLTAAAGRRLTTLKCHDTACKVAEVVVSGGVRNPASKSVYFHSCFTAATSDAIE